MIENNLAQLFFGRSNNWRKEELGILETFFANPGIPQQSEKKMGKHYCPSEQQHCNCRLQCCRKSLTQKVTMDLPRVTYDPVSNLRQSVPPICSDVIVFWAFDNWPAFTAICSVLRSHNHNLQLTFFFLPETSFAFISGKKHPLA